MVVQDGLSRATGWNLPSVMDSLIAEHKIPVTIGIFVDHGTVASTHPDYYPRYNRSFEYDALGDRYARFLLEELLPEISRSYNLSRDPNDRSIAGASSGAICAFNVAWERPDQFRRVLSTIGTYVGLRGGDEFVTLIRKTEPKPLRIFLEDGTQDLNIYGGDWWMANQGMLSALKYAGYEVTHSWGEGGGHNSNHAREIMAEALAWLWKDYPEPVKTHIENNARINLIAAGESWREIGPKDVRVDKLAVNRSGEVFFSDKQTIYKLGQDETAGIFAKVNGAVGGFCLGSNGSVYVADLSNHKILSIKENGRPHELISNVDASFLTASDSVLYFSETAKNRIGVYRFFTRKIVYQDVPFKPTGLALSADQSFMNVGSSDHVFGYSLKVAKDGGVDFGQEYIHYHVPYGESLPGTGGMTVDTDNLLYSATNMGIQVSDQLGRINFIFSNPAKGPVDVKFGGAGLTTLYAACDGKLFSRKIKAKGVHAALPPVKPPKPGL
jgi:predicted alpha/beta superfamily hydrolase/sugar lactone lactonase YvrE